MRFYKLSFLLLAGFFALLPFAAAQEPSHVKVRILPEYGTVAPGQKLWIGIEQSIAPDWHTYWKNPGDSGTAPRIDWQAPEGFIFSDIHWPAPQKLPYGTLLNYGYEDHVILLQKLTLPEKLPRGPLALKATFEVLVCKEECIPEFSEHTLLLNDPDSMGEDNSTYLQAALRKIPKPADWRAFFEEKDGDFLLVVEAPDADTLDSIDPFSLTFFPESWGLVNNSAETSVTLEGRQFKMAQSRGDRPLSALENTPVILAYETADGQRESITITAWEKSRLPPSAEDENNEQIDQDFSSLPRPSLDAGTILSALIFAFLGGVILNLMPCVFPVLSIKALSLVKISQKSAALARAHGIAYTAGIVLSFLIIAGLLIILKSAGHEIGWGFQLQNPVIVTILAYLLFVIGLNLAGLFEMSNPFGNIGHGLTQGTGVKNSFFTGILAMLVATPCTAPFMAAAIGFAATQPVAINLTIFTSLGLGLAAPYLLLSFAPALQRVLPKPGPWMERFKQFLAFPMFASAAWLVWVVSQQTGPLGVLGALMGMVALAFAFWLWHAAPREGGARWLVQGFSVLAFLLSFGFLGTEKQLAACVAPQNPAELGRTYSAHALEAALAGNRPVFVEMTAAWCITCKVNHAVALNVDSTKALFKERNVDYLVGDWTNYDPEITHYLDSFGRNGVPIYVYYAPPDPKTGKRPGAEILPQILTPGIVAETLGGI